MFFNNINTTTGYNHAILMIETSKWTLSGGDDEANRSCCAWQASLYFHSLCVHCLDNKSERFYPKIDHNLISVQKEVPCIVQSLSIFPSTFRLYDCYMREKLTIYRWELAVYGAVRWLIANHLFLFYAVIGGKHFFWWCDDCWRCKVRYRTSAHVSCLEDRNSNITLFSCLRKMPPLWNTLKTSQYYTEIITILFHFVYVFKWMSKNAFVHV